MFLCAIINNVDVGNTRSVCLVKEYLLAAARSPSIVQKTNVNLLENNFLQSWPQTVLQVSERRKGNISNCVGDIAKEGRWEL